MGKDSLPLILCFGDSLTAGYQSPTMACPQVQETPYGRFLQNRLGVRARVAVSGLCGETTGEMVSRFRRNAEPQRPAWAVILGGTNDLGGSIAPTDIMDNLTDMYEWALAQGIRPVAVTVPSIRLGGDFEDASRAPDWSTVQHEAVRWVADHIARRRMLNRLIMGYCARRGMACIDLFADTAEPNTGQLAARYSNDGLHLTTDGYRRLADLLYEQVFGPALSCS
jgi:lysophospholipase L1-like esterase